MMQNTVPFYNIAHKFCDQDLEYAGNPCYTSSLNFILAVFGELASILRFKIGHRNDPWR
jgi:hypothetical protein